MNHAHNWNDAALVCGLLCVIAFGVGFVCCMIAERRQRRINRNRRNK